MIGQIREEVLSSGDQAKIKAAEALAKALTLKQWGVKDLTRNKRATQRLFDQLVCHCLYSEVADFLRRVQADPVNVDSRELHYLQRRYLDGRDFSDPSALEKLYDRVLEDPEATVHRKGGVRYQVRSPREGWIAIIEPDGLRVSVYPDLDDDLGDALWRLNDLIL